MKDIYKYIYVWSVEKEIKSIQSCQEKGYIQVKYSAIFGDEDEKVKLVVRGKYRDVNDIVSQVKNTQMK